MKGRSDLTVINVQQKLDFTFNMWDNDIKKRKTKALFTVASRNCTKIFGVTIDINESFLLIFAKLESEILNSSPTQLPSLDDNKPFEKTFVTQELFKSDSNFKFF
jgi:hypothetical protein